ncbi:CAP domain-containing protein [Lentzea sp. NPDC042327]|uniref:CAP domain-containing protein n=1 Tax=Lentzea sp. NPDC042327 TaxID=3154801 RepID=UPI0033F8C1E1
MSARSLLLGLLIGATGVGGLAVSGTSPLGIGVTSAARQESTDAANQFGSGSAAAPGRQTAGGTPVQGTATPSSSSSAPTTSTTTATPSSTSSSAAPTTTTTTQSEAPKPPDPPKPPTGDKTPEQAVLALVNDARAAKGCKALVIDDRVTTAAQAHSTDMASRKYFSHDTPEGVDFAERMKAAGYPKPGGENIAQGYRTAEQVMQGWMNSSGHKANIENCKFTTMGVGLDTRGFYWTQNFGF